MAKLELKFSPQKWKNTAFISYLLFPFTRRDGRAGQGRQRGRGEAGRAGGGGARPPHHPRLLEDRGGRPHLSLSANQLDVELR